ncbi:hypothetical protein [Nocardioides sp. AX2bis]|uniref:hypothetical protein n=1 Tax=Nocardioides sp. AX2bis TaxID=2653157 RepID=UPI0012F07ACB|nr:hypothetical protein [Nocardioides sp. AX2bis]VXC44264.1 conserved hypothetical protein [Nocardioides sp. AX2bis]
MPEDTTPTRMVRLLLNDVAPNEHDQVFTSEEIADFLALEGGSVKRAAAQAIDTNADNELLASKVLTDHQISTDGAKLADSMRKRAAALRAQADREETKAVEDSDDGFFFGVVNVVSGPDPHGWYV